MVEPSFTGVLDLEQTSQVCKSQRIDLEKSEAGPFEVNTTVNTTGPCYATVRYTPKRGEGKSFAWSEDGESESYLMKNASALMCPTGTTPTPPRVPNVMRIVAPNVAPKNAITGNVEIAQRTEKVENGVVVRPGKTMIRERIGVVGGHRELQPAREEERLVEERVVEHVVQKIEDDSWTVPVELVNGLDRQDEDGGLRVLEKIKSQPLPAGPDDVLKKIEVEDVLGKKKPPWGAPHNEFCVNSEKIIRIFDKSMM